MPFNFERLTIPEIQLIRSSPSRDARGAFMESYKRSEFAAHGITEPFVQENYSNSVRGVLRGLHFQRPPQGQSKLVRVISGTIFDVAVDLRPESATSRQWVGVELSAEAYTSLYVPSWCAHGFCVLSERAEV